MILRRWEDLPESMLTPEVRKYYDILCGKKPVLVCKRIFDILAALILTILLSPVFLIVAIAVKLDSNGPVIYSQIRVTRYHRYFLIYKFRSMVVNKGEELQLTVSGNERITRVGKVIRKYRLDEIPQLINVLKGDMSFVGTRPEVPRYVDHYTPEMMATLLLRAGVTGNASIEYKEEEFELADASDPVRHYIDVILPEKMKYNLKDIEEIGFLHDLKIMFRTVSSVFR